MPLFNPLGTGTVTTSGSPVSGDIAAFSSSSAVAPASATGTGDVVRATTPTLITPVLGVATGTSVNLSGNCRAATFNVGASAGVDASIVIPAVATITVSKGIITAVV